MREKITAGCQPVIHDEGGPILLPDIVGPAQFDAVRIHEVRVMRAPDGELNRICRVINWKFGVNLVIAPRI